MRKNVSSSGEEGNNEYKKGLWTVEEDKILMDYVKAHGKGHWNRIAKKTGLSFTLSIALSLNIFVWSLIAKRVPGRTDNQVKNYWNTHLSKKLGTKDPKNKPSNGDIVYQINLTNPTETLEETKIWNINDNDEIQEDRHGSNYLSSLWVHDDAFELSTLTNMMDFLDGHCF
ncbi:hypothetical protein YC2023_119854 [Brassica napus]